MTPDLTKLNPNTNPRLIGIAFGPFKRIIIKIIIFIPQIIIFFI